MSGFFPDPEDYEPAAPTASARQGVPPGAGAFQQQRGVPEDDAYDEEGEAALEAMLMNERRDGSSGGAGASSSLSAARGEDDEDNESEAPPPVLGTCHDCKQKEGQSKFFEAFSLSVCYDCQRAGKAQGGRYQVITKSKAKDEYLLTDRHLAKENGGLGCMTVPNPRDNRYGDMRLYLRSQVEQLALKLWGSDEALFAEKERRMAERLEKADKKKRKAAQPQGVSSNPAAAKRAAAQAAKHQAKVASVSHTHNFSPDEQYDEESDTWTKVCCECGFEVQYERI